MGAQLTLSGQECPEDQGRVCAGRSGREGAGRLQPASERGPPSSPHMHRPTHLPGGLGCPPDKDFSTPGRGPLLQAAVCTPHPSATWSRRQAGARLHSFLQELAALLAWTPGLPPTWAQGQGGWRGCGLASRVSGRSLGSVLAQGFKAQSSYPVPYSSPKGGQEGSGGGAPTQRREGGA